MYEIKKLNKISAKIEEVFNSNYQLGEEFTNPDGILVRSAQMSEYEVNDKLVAIARAGAGVNNIPVERMAESGVVVFNTPGANANAVKELVICGLFIASRDIIGGSNWINTVTENTAKTAEKGKSQFAGTEIFGKTLGVIGLGAIGRLVADAAVNLGMNVIGYDPFLPDASKLNSKVKVASFDEVVKNADYITIHVPYIESTKNLINSNVINSMKDGVIILNMARGEIVNVDDLKAAIETGKVRKYVVDFPSENVINSKNIIVLPHLGASTEEAEDNCAVMAGKQLVDYIENGNIVNSVNYPRLVKERVAGKKRTCVLFKASDLSKIESIKNAVVATKGNFGYAIVDDDNYINVDFAIKTRNI